MPEQNPEKTSGYVRVSRVMGREGESYISPKVQEEAIQRGATRHGIEIIAVDTDEDQSGRHPRSSRAALAIAPIESDGIVVAKLNRLTTPRPTFPRAAVDRPGTVATVRAIRGAAAPATPALRTLARPVRLLGSLGRLRRLQRCGDRWARN